MSRFDPFRDLDRLMSDTMRTTTPAASAMPMDLFRAGETFVARVDLPGVDPGSIDVDVEDRLGRQPRDGRGADVLDRRGRHPGERLVQGGRDLVELLGPADQRQMVLAARAGGRADTELAAHIIDRYDRVGALVRVDPECHHGPVTFHVVWKKQRDRPVGTRQWGRCHAPIKPHRPVSRVQVPAQSMMTTKGTHSRSQTPGRRPV